MLFSLGRSRISWDWYSVWLSPDSVLAITWGKDDKVFIWILEDHQLFHSICM